jgi:hypothetical protein
MDGVDHIESTDGVDHRIENSDGVDRVDGIGDTRRALGGFLRARRGRVAPEHVGFAGGRRRRVRGLRREEPAQLAGISVDYYVRLEQGRATQPSPEVSTRSPGRSASTRQSASTSPPWPAQGAAPHPERTGH